MKADHRRKAGWQSILDHLRKRRSVFPPAFTEEPVSRGEIEKILEAANWAPTHKLTQPWRFVVIRGSSRSKLSEYLLQYYLKHTPADLILEKKKKKIVENARRASAIIAICMHIDNQNLVPEWEELAATACAVQNLWLAATALGIGGYWSSPAALSDIKGFLSLKNEERCIGLFYLGYHESQHSEPNRTPWQDKVRWMD